MKLTSLKTATGGAIGGALAARLYDVGHFINDKLSYVNHKIATGEVPIPTVPVDSYEKAFYGNGMWEAAFAGAAIGAGLGYGISKLVNRRRVPTQEKLVKTQPGINQLPDYVARSNTDPALREGVSHPYSLREEVLTRAKGIHDTLERRSQLHAMGLSEVSDVGQQDFYDTLYEADFNIGEFPTRDSFHNFGIQLMEKVISNGGHSGNTHRGWFKDGKLSFPVNISTPDKLYKNGRAEIQIDSWGNIAVRANGVVAYYLTREGYLDQSRNTCTGTGELGRVLDIIEDLAPKFTGEPIGKSLETLVKVREKV